MSPLHQLGLNMNCPSCGLYNQEGTTTCPTCGTNLATSADEAVTAEDRRFLSTGFVGRQREMGELRAALEEAVSGRGRLVMLVGEPGIGKTRTAQELASHAEGLGALVLWGRCYEEEGAPPYWPWLQSIRAYVQRADLEQLRSEMGPGAADIAEIVPEVREKLPDLEKPPSLEPEQARFRLFDSITSFWKNAAQSQPLMLVLDDLHWADRSSLLLLEFVAREIQSSSLLLLGIYRDVEVSRRHPLSQTLGSLIREERFLRVQLTGLVEPEVEQLIQGAASVSPPAGLSATVHRRTEGNPLFVTEIIRMLPGEGLEEGQEYIASIPEGVRDAIGQRLNRLSEECNQTLTVASIIGREFDFRLLRLVDEALEAHVIEELPQARERYQFSHALVQETLSEELSTSRKVRLHARIGRALEGRYGAGAEAHASELAYHFGEAEPVLGPEKLVHYSLLAGERALATYAWEEGLAHFERGLEAKEGEPMDPETAELLFGLARANLGALEQFEIQRMRESVAQLGRAFNYYTEIGELDRAVAVAEYPVRAALGVPIGEGELITRALALVSADSHQAGRLLANSGLILYQEKGDYPGAQEAFSQALVLARREQDTALEMRILANATSVDFHHLRWQECLEKGAQAVKLSDGVDDLYAATFGSFFTARVLDYTGDPHAAGQRVEEMQGWAERFRDRDLSSRALYISGLLSLHQGNWPESRDLLDRSLEIAPGTAPHLCARAVLEYQPGDFDQGRSHVARLVDATRRSPMGAGFA